MMLRLVFVLAIVLLIPSYGVSLIGFFLIKKVLDVKAARRIVKIAGTSLNTGVTHQLSHINKSAVDEVFKRFCVESSKDGRKFKGATVFWGVFQHPEINEGYHFSMRIIYTDKREAYIRVLPGINAEIFNSNIFSPFGEIWILQ